MTEDKQFACPHCGSTEASFTYSVTGIRKRYAFVPVVNGFSHESVSRTKGSPDKVAKCEQCKGEVSVAVLKRNCAPF